MDMRIAGALLTCLATLGVVAHANAAACEGEAFRQFDFWLGDWKVSKPDGSFAGFNRIGLEYDGCVVHEHYANGRGYSGESLNIYDKSRKVWHQTWTDNQGTLLILEGHWDGTAMVLEGQEKDAKGNLASHRMTWTPNADGSVRQLWESTDAQGNWVVGFDGRYTKK